MPRSTLEISELLVEYMKCQLIFCINFAVAVVRDYDTEPRYISVPPIVRSLVRSERLKAGLRRSDWRRRPFRDRSKPLAFKWIRAILILRTRAASMSQPY
jgi:hypothetical protein